MQKSSIILRSCSLFISSLLITVSFAVEKPIGTFSSAGGRDDPVVNHAEVRGVLIRPHWANIEPTPGTFDFRSIDSEASKTKAAGKGWSLGLLSGGTASPAWLTESLGARGMPYERRGEPGYFLPLWWDSTVIERLAIVIDTLGKRYNSDGQLKLVYVTQMSSNGIEGHLQGVDMDAFRDSGFTSRKWIDAAEYTARLTAAAYPDKPVAIELHEIDNSVKICDTILYDLYNDPALEQRVGAGMWWISGKTSYMPDLIQLLTDFPGDVYGQVIGKSSTPERFLDSNYTTVFEQAREIGMRYIEPWNYEFENNTFDSVMHSYNLWADSVYGQPTTDVKKKDGAVYRENGISLYAASSSGFSYDVPNDPTSSFTVTLYNATGRKLFQTGSRFSGSGRFSWKERAFKSGIYILRVSGTHATPSVGILFVRR